ncbi:alcohol dehydrogenase catalytic domain-containing protein [Mahella australiensis]|uniref:Alcohol dehydrogenase GroES domain protein n=1 Tax=Mahella australiensis (strain DSM 15567 / CIP 107919 / 50-1 BON) TaxID=697281 RepID=F4A0P9_MAHA5|nr:Zn-dependent alcohol dehydrogenase [Mahella australiensis]AEE96945.1 Alcohol dehydrogenase GroES domain protein [Mahella australiensis 50-1 BON]
MKSIIMEGPRKSKVIDVEVPRPQDGELLVKLTYTGMCHSEWYPWSVAKPGDKFGHEPIGVVAEVGPNVQGFHVGDRVTGLGGGYAEYCIMEAQNTVHVPDVLADEDAIAEPLSCIVSAVSRMPIVTAGDPVAVVGAGYMGLGAISLFRLRGAGRIIAVDPREEARENALRFGATEVYSPEELPENYKVTMDHMGDIFNNGFSTVMEFAGTESALRLAGDMVCAHGTLGVGGYHNDTDRVVDFMEWNFKAINVINAHERRTAYQVHCCQNALDLLAAGLWQFKGLANNIYTMEEFDQANADMENKPKGFIKALVRCSI